MCVALGPPEFVAATWCGSWLTSCALSLGPAPDWAWPDSGDCTYAIWYLVRRCTAIEATHECMRCIATHCRTNKQTSSAPLLTKHLIKRYIFLSVQAMLCYA